MAYLTERQAAERLNVSVSTLRYWRNCGDGREYYKLGTTKRSPVRYPFAHAHAPEPNLKVEHMDGDEFFRWLKEQVTVRQKKKASDKCPQQS